MFQPPTVIPRSNIKCRLNQRVFFPVPFNNWNACQHLFSITNHIVYCIWSGFLFGKSTKPNYFFLLASWRLFSFHFDQWKNKKTNEKTTANCVHPEQIKWIGNLQRLQIKRIFQKINWYHHNRKLFQCKCFISCNFLFFCWKFFLNWNCFFFVILLEIVRCKCTCGSQPFFLVTLLNKKIVVLCLVFCF